MTLIAFGINHKTAPVELREKVAFSPDAMVEALKSLAHLTGADESVIVSTCNRTEIYAQAENLTADALTTWLAEFHQAKADELGLNSYIYHQEDAIKHIMRVACGLDSLILGEPLKLDLMLYQWLMPRYN